MSDMTQKLDHFAATILAEATAETEQALEALKIKRTAAHSAAEDRILFETYNYVHNEVARIQAENGRRTSRHMLDDKRTLYLRREEIAVEVFALVQTRIDAFTKTAAYRTRLTVLYRDCLQRLSPAADIKVYLRAEDGRYAGLLERTVPGVQAVFVDGTFSLGGLIAESLTLGLRLDCSFDSALAALTGHFAELFGISVSDITEG